MANYPLNMTAKDRQLWYWQREMDILHKRMNECPNETEEHERLKAEYVKAVKTYREVSGLEK